MELTYNVSDYIKNLPKDREIYCSMYGYTAPCHHDEQRDAIVWNGIWFNNDGSFIRGGDCMLWPTKDRRMWNHWQDVLFKPGDVIVNDGAKDGMKMGLFMGNYTIINRTGHKDTRILIENYRFADENESKEFFDELKERGIEWFEHSKILVDTNCDGDKDIDFRNYVMPSVDRDRDLFPWFYSVHQDDCRSYGVAKTRERAEEEVLRILNKNK